jgi:hypothetical protein
MLESGGYCGIDCDACPALLATRKDDKAALAAVAAEWSKLYGADIPPESIPCAGCFARPPQATGCHAHECAIRTCAMGRGVDTCAECADYACDRLAGFLAAVPEAKANLEARRKG